jgi:hypothetical protein
MAPAEYNSSKTHLQRLQPLYDMMHPAETRKKTCVSLSVEFKALDRVQLKYRIRSSSQRRGVSPLKHQHPHTVLGSHRRGGDRQSFAPFIPAGVHPTPTPRSRPTTGLPPRERSPRRVPKSSAAAIITKQNRGWVHEERGNHSALLRGLGASIRAHCLGKRKKKCR